MIRILLVVSIILAIVSTVLFTVLFVLPFYVMVYVFGGICLLALGWRIYEWIKDNWEEAGRLARK